MAGSSRPGEMVVLHRPASGRSVGTQILYFLDPVFERRAQDRAAESRTAADRGGSGSAGFRRCFGFDERHAEHSPRGFRIAVAFLLGGGLAAALHRAGRTRRPPGQYDAVDAAWALAGAALQGSIARGAVVSLCPPDNDVFRKAMRRGYITSGVCPGGYEPLLKPVAAISGDVVSVTAAGIAVNGIPVANTAALAQDECGPHAAAAAARPLPGFAGRTYGSSPVMTRAASTAGILARCRQRTSRALPARSG